MHLARGNLQFYIPFIFSETIFLNFHQRLFCCGFLRIQLDFYKGWAICVCVCVCTLAPIRSFPLAHCHLKSEQTWVVVFFFFF